MFKARMKFAKEGRAKYISHLDLMHTMQRAMARCQMPIWFTEGFNQHAYVSVALPLSTGYSGEWEFLDFNLLSENVPINAVEAINAVFPQGLRALEIYPLSDGGMPLREIAWSKYRIVWTFEQDSKPGKEIQDFLQQDTIEIVKRSKRGEKIVNMKELIAEMQITIQKNQMMLEVITAAGNNNLSPEYLTKAVEQAFPQYKIIGESYHRMCVYNQEMQAFR